MVSPSSAPAQGTPPPGLGDILLLSLKATGAAGVFAAVGYTASAAHQHFLGINVEVNSLTQLTFTAAAFWFDSIMTVLQQAETHWIATLAMVLCFAALWWPHLAFSRSGKRLHLASEVGIAGLLMVIGVGILVWCELPTIQLRDVMITGLCAQPGVGKDTMLNGRTKQLWSLIVVSRGIRLNCSSDSPVSVSKDRGEEGDRADGSLKDTYALTFLAAVAGWLLVYLRSERPWARWVRPFRIIGIVALAVNTCMIPYMYGKLISPITMPRVHVRLQDKVDAAAMPKNGQPATSRAPQYLEGANLLVAENDRSVILLNFSSGISQVLEIPRAEIKSIGVMLTVDALIAGAENTPREPPPH
jgi:hypothetical protein